MKKKSFFSGINTKLVLAALALSSVVMTGCYKDDGLDPNGPVGVVELPDATYTLTGSIYDATTMAAVTPTSVTVTGATASFQAGSYSAAVAPGQVVVTVEAAGYNKATATVYIQAVAKGQAVVYTQPIAMIKPAAPEVVMVDKKYNINVSAYELDGTTAVANATVKINGADVANPYLGGTYGILVTADGFQAYATTVNLPALKVEEGSAADVVMDVNVAALMTKVDAPAPEKVNIIVDFKTSEGNYFNVQRAWLQKDGVDITEAVATNTSRFAYEMNKADLGLMTIVYQFQATVNGALTTVIESQVVKPEDNYYALVSLAFSASGDLTGSSNNVTANQEEEVIVPIGGGELTIPASTKDAEGNVIPNATTPTGEAVESITLQRDVAEEVNEPVTLRAYIGTPEGTQFAEPIVITFSDIYGGELGDLVVKYKQNDGSWASEVNEYTAVKLGENGYEMKIAHFSEFKADVNVENEAPIETPVVTEKVTEVGKNNDTENPTTIKIQRKYNEGAVYTNSIANVVSAAGINNTLAQGFVAQAIRAYLNENGYGEFKNEATFEMEYTVPAYTRVVSVKAEVTTNKVTIPFTINGKAIVMELEKYVSTTFTVETTPINHGHGHGAGNDFGNAGGGIIAAE